jgi:hypothetical protein
MSRAYRIKVKESLTKVIRASDHVSTQLELLEILPPEQMAELLAEELRGRGFRPEGRLLVREDKGVTIQIDPQTATVRVRAESQERLDLEAEIHAVVDMDEGKPATEKTRQRAQVELHKDLQKQADEKVAALRQQVTDELEGRLADLRKELDRVVNRVTAEALKRKAAQLGQIKEMTEDPQSGSLTIVVEV